MSDITTLRATLFDTLNQLKTGEIEIDKARAINDVAQTIINTAKTEIDFLRVAGGSGTGFIPDARPALPNAGGTTKTLDVPDVPGLADQLSRANVRTHKLKG